MIFDVEIFTLDSEVSNGATLILPFRILLKKKLRATCELSLSGSTYMASGKKRQMKTLKKNQFAAKTLRKELGLSPEHKKPKLGVPLEGLPTHLKEDNMVAEVEKEKPLYELVNVNHSLLGYFATKADFSFL